MAHGAAVLVGGARDDELTEAAEIEVDQRLGEPTRYTLTLPVGIRGGDFPLLTDARLGPGADIAVVAAAGGRRACLVWGPVTGQRVTLVRGGAGSVLRVDGADASVVMAREDRAEVWADVSDSAAVSAVAARHGFAADVRDTGNVHPADGHALVQREPDLAFVARLARRNGCVVWLTSTEEGAHTLHFRPPPVDGDPEAELSVTVEPPSVEVLEIAWDAERPTAASASGLDPRSKQVLDGAPGDVLPARLAATPFARIAAGGPRTVWVNAVADDTADLRARTAAELAENAFFVTASGSTTTALAGRVLRAPSVVRVRGAGSRHSGRWLCARVRHVIGATAHTMHFDLVRDGWGEQT
ncbi:contractile injection system protein, VgrG/Pvc8 family [Streptomyces sp. NPDC006372]|uniref:phage late control D family protein n=1 Tax=Streptomyces sp. NPDC006372 TaxID=3155599 RepID=UPI0033B4F0EE